MDSSLRTSADPVTDLLGRMESQISRMETVRSEPPASSLQIGSTGTESPELRALRDELAQSERRSIAQLALFTDAITALKEQIPELLDQAVSSRFAEAEERFYAQIRETHQRAMEGFLQTGQARVGTRMASVEVTMADQARTMAELQDNFIKTDRNVDRLLSGLDRLTAELMRLSSLAGAPIVTRRVAQLSPVPASATKDTSEPVLPRRLPQQEFTQGEPDRESARQPNRGLSLVLPFVLIVFVAGLAVAGWLLYRAGNGPRSSVAKTASSPSQETTGTAAQMKTAAAFASEKEYAKAEVIYRAVVKSEPNNRTAIKELASVLFRQQRYEEAAAVLKSLPPGS